MQGNDYNSFLDWENDVEDDDSDDYNYKVNTPDEEEDE